MSALRFVLIYLVIAALAAVQSFGRTELDARSLRNAVLVQVEKPAR